MIWFSGVFEKTKYHLYRKIRHVSIHYRLITLFMLLSLLPMVVLGFYFYRQSSEAITSKISTYSLQIVDQVAMNVEVEMNRLEYDTIEIGFSDLVQDTLINYENMTAWEQFNTEHLLQKMLVKKFSFLHDVSDVLFFTMDDEKITGYGDSTYGLKLKSNYLDDLLQEVKEKRGAPVWKTVDDRDELHVVERIINDKNGIIIGRSINNLSEGDQLGAIIIRTNERYISRIYHDIELGNGAEIFLLDAAGLVVSSRNEEIPFNEYFKTPNFVENLKACETEGDRVFFQQIGEQKNMVAFSPIGNTNWYVVSTIPYSYLYAEPVIIRDRIIILSIFCFILAVILSLLYTKSISFPLDQLISKMNQVKKGDLSIEMADESSDEIAQVTNNFNEMVKEIKNLLRDIKEKEKQKRKAELKALQAQINPHFISNVLNKARLLAQMQKADNLEGLMTNLIELLRLSMRTDEDLITVREEMKYLRSYINIQQFRYLNKFTVDFEIEDEILGCKIPRFLLQPVLENSIIHGIEPKKGPGVIEIKGFSYK
ncbi:MAG TPA: histidine kinase, partial [Halanaerobiales bacterium]|nr:histidine kinase [Halanaerobiales bacterium]